MPPKKLIDNETKIRISRKLTAAKLRETQYVRAALFSATRAALQVLDKRIGFLEKKAEKGSEEFEIGEFFVDVVVDLIIGQAAGKLLHLGLERLLRPVIRSRQAYYVMPRLPGKHKDFDFEVRAPPEVRLDADTLKRIRKDARKQLKRHFGQAVNSEDFGAYKSIPAAVNSSVLEVGSDTARSMVNLGAAKVPAASSTRQGMTVVVQVFTSAQETYTSQQGAVDTLYDGLNARLLYSEIDIETGADWESFLDAAEGWDQQSFSKYNELLFTYYELAMWAHSVDLNAVAAEKPLHIATREISDQLVEQELRSLQNHTIESRNEKQVTYRFPRSRGGGLAKMEKTVAITEDRLNYWINRFPASFEELEGPTILQWYEDRYSSDSGERPRSSQLFRGTSRSRSDDERDAKKKKEAIEVMAYEHVLGMFEGVDAELKRSYRALNDARALDATYTLLKGIKDFLDL